MGIFKKSAPKQNRIHETQWYDETFKLSEKLSRHYGINHEFAVYLEHAIGEAYICAEMNATACSKGVLRLYKRKGSNQGVRMGTRTRKVKNFVNEDMRGGRYGTKIADFTHGGAEMVEVKSHPVLDLLKTPNWMFPGNELEHLSWLYQWIGGNAYDKISFAGSTPIQQSPLYAQYVSIVASDEVGIDHYAYGRSGQSFGEYTPDEVVHYKLQANPHHPLYGRSPLQAVLPHVDLVNDSLIYDIALAKNGMRPDFMMTVDSQTTDEQIDEIEKRMMDKFRGVKNWSKGLFLKGMATFTPTAWPEKELLSLPKREEASKLIRKAYGHTESMADSTDSNYASALIGFDAQYLGMTIEPALMRNAAQKEQLLRMFGLDTDVYAFAYDPLVTKDEAKQAERLRADFTGGIMTANEVRIERGLEPIMDDENADKLLMNGQPLGAIAAANNPFAAMFGGGGDAKPDGGGSGDPTPPGGGDDPDDNTEKSVATPEPIDIMKSVLDLESPLWKPCEGCRQTKDDDIAEDHALKEALKRFQGKVESVSRDVITDMQADSVRAYANGNTPDLDSLKGQAVGEFRNVMKDIVDFGVINVLENRGNILGNVSVPAEAFEIVPERALKFLEKYTIELVDDIAGTTADMAKRAVEVGLKEGLSIKEIAKQIEGVPQYRAELISRMEVQRAVQHGKREGFIAVGVEKHKAINAPGARPEHQKIAAQGAIPIDQPFVKAGETIGDETYKRDIYAPPFWFGCRCGVVPVFESE